MITELETGSFTDVLPLYHSTAHRFPLISVVLEGKQRGQVFVDKREAPDAAFVVTDFGFTYLFEARQNKEFDTALSRLIATQGALKPSYLLWYEPPEHWQEKLDAIGSENIRRRGRIRFQFREEQAEWLNDEVQSPEGFELRPLSAELIPKTEKFNVKLDSRFWSSADDFERNALAVCLTKNDEVVSLCYAAAVGDGMSEVDVVTDADFRGHGLANVVTQQFIKGSLARGITPTWDCFDYNTASMKLAQKVGFVEMRRYPFYSFNVPLLKKT